MAHSCNDVSGFRVVYCMPGQTQSCKVLKNEIVVVVTTAPAFTNQTTCDNYCQMQLIMLIKLESKLKGSVECWTPPPQ